jgi:hypothetical protein
VIRVLIASGVLVVSLLGAGSGGAALEAGSASLSVTSAGTNQVVFQVQNTGPTVIASFVVSIGPGFSANSVVGTTGGTCQVSGGTLTCSGLSLAPGCDCNPGGSVAVTVSGSGDPAGSSLSQVVEFAPAAGGTPSAGVTTPSTPAVAQASNATRPKEPVGLRYCQRPTRSGQSLAATPSLTCATAKAVLAKLLANPCRSRAKCTVVPFACSIGWNGAQDVPHENETICRHAQQIIELARD